MWQIVSHSTLLYTMVLFFFLSTLQHGSLINLNPNMQFDQSAIELNETDPDAHRLKINFVINRMWPFVMCCVSNVLHTTGDASLFFGGKRFIRRPVTIKTITCVCDRSINRLSVSIYYDVTHFIILLILSWAVFFGTSVVHKQTKESTSPTTLS